ncbi:MAG TPA: alpha/beta hydrolase [Longimicrobium sp.]
MRRGLAVAFCTCVALAGCRGSAPAPGMRAQATPAEGYLAGAAGGRIFYRVAGRGGDTVVVVHGGPGAGMGAVAPDLEPLERRHTLVYYDQRGGGRSELPQDTALLGPEHHLEDLDAVRRYFGLERMTLLAHSFGAVIAARYAMAHPGRVERMVFTGAVEPRRTDAAATAMAAFAHVDTARLHRLFTLMGRIAGGEGGDAAEACREYEAIAREGAAARGEPARWRGTACEMPPEALRYYMRYTARIGPNLFGQWDFTGQLGHVRAPLLVVYGGRDTAAVRAQRGWAAAVPDGRLLVVPGAGKGAHADRPEVFFPAVEEFLRGRWPAGAEPPH